jgi:hypothetical protein
MRTYSVGSCTLFITLGLGLVLGGAGCAGTSRRAAADVSNEAARTCTGLSEQDRATNPLQGQVEIVAVDEIRSWPYSPKQLQAWGPVQGASVTVRATPGVTEEYLERVVRCHVALAQSAGGTSGPNPLAVPGARATVSSAGPGFRIDIVGEDKKSARTILVHANELAAANAQPIKTTY